MRPLRFRFWYKGPYGVPCWCPGMGLDENGIPVEDDCAFVRCDPEHYDIEQFTGLVDKNGKDIYEGDILSWEPNEEQRLKWWSEEYGRGDLAIVEWYELRACWIASVQSCHGGEGHEELTAKGYKDRWIVLGNIHEHQHLLT